MVPFECINPGVGVNIPESGAAYCIHFQRKSPLRTKCVAIESVGTLSRVSFLVSSRRLSRFCSVLVHLQHENGVGEHVIRRREIAPAQVRHAAELQQLEACWLQHVAKQCRGSGFERSSLATQTTVHWQILSWCNAARAVFDKGREWKHYREKEETLQAHRGISSAHHYQVEEQWRSYMIWMQHLTDLLEHRPRFVSSVQHVHETGRNGRGRNTIRVITIGIQEELLCDRYLMMSYGCFAWTSGCAKSAV